MTQRRHLLAWNATVLACGVWIFALLSLASFRPGDWPSHSVASYGEVKNLCGSAGSWFAYHAMRAIGQGVYPILFFAAVYLGLRLMNQRVGDFWMRVMGLCLLAISFGAIVHQLRSGGSSSLPEGFGGVIGIATAQYLSSHFNSFGAWIVLLVTVAIGVLLTADELVVKAMPVAASAMRNMKEKSQAVAMSFPPLPRLPQLLNREVIESTPPEILKPKKLKPAKITAEVDDEAEPLPKRTKLNAKAKALEDLRDQTEKEAQEIVDVDDVEEIEDAVVADAEAQVAAAAAPEAEEEEPPAPRKDIIVRLAAAMPMKRTAPPPPKELGEYVMPGWEVLAEAEHGFAESQEKYVREKAAILEQALREFGIDAHVVEIDTGPVITMYEITLAAGIRVSAITALTNDISRALAAVSIRIIAPVPGKNTVGIEVPNNEKEKVRMKELMQTAPEKTSKFAIPLYLGKDASGQPLIADLTSMPHCLIAGTTGSGKSVCINSIIMSIMYTQRPDMVKLILIDPKVVEMAPFKDIPHLMCPVITETSKATSVLEWACEKMEERYAVLADAGVRNIQGYNALTREELFERLNATTVEEQARVPKKLPYLVIIIDELADLMMTSGKEVEASIVRIAQKARAVGIHLVLATQRPQATVVTGLIKANMPSKIAFRVSSRMDSRIVLDMNGAEVLLGQGDMLYLPNGASKPTRSQGTYIDDKEVRDSVKLVKSLAEQQFEPELVQIRAATGDVDSEAVKDEMFDEAVRVVLETRRGSVSLLQRRLTIGYARASRLVEAMYASGIVGEYKGSQAREPLVTLEEYEAMRSQQESDQADGMTA